MTGPWEQRLEYALRFEFPTSNNEATYEALIQGMELANDVEAHKLIVHNDSQLVAEQVNGKYEAKELTMVKYL